MTLWIMLVQARPFDEAVPEEDMHARAAALLAMRERIKAGSPILTPTDYARLGARLLAAPHLEPLLMGMLALAPGERWTADAALASPWFSDMETRMET